MSPPGDHHLSALGSRPWALGAPPSAPFAAPSVEVSAPTPPPPATPRPPSPGPRFRFPLHGPLPLPPLALLGALGLIALLAQGSHLANPYHLDIALNIGIAALLAVSLNLVNGYTGQFSLGHAGFMAVGAYLSATLTLFVGPALAARGLAVPPALLFPVALLTGGIGAALAGLLVGLPTLRLRGDYLALVTLGFGEIIRVLLQNIEALGGALGLNNLPPFTGFGWTYAWLAIALYTIFSLVHSTYGRGFLAVRDDELAARAIGLNPTRYKVVAFTVAAFFAGIAGGLFAHLKQSILPTGFDFTRSIEIVVMVILGGMGNTLGVLLAAALLTLLPELLREVAEYRLILYSLLLIVLMLVRPQGLLPAQRRPTRPRL